MRSRFTLLAGLAVFSAVAASAQPAGCPSCLADFDSMVAQAESSYVAFPLEVWGSDREADYRDMTSTARARARAATTAEECFYALQTWADWFNDGHLLVLQIPRPTDEEKAVYAASAEFYPLTDRLARAYFRDHAAALDPVEGIWYDEAGDYAVVRAPAWAGYDFVAVTLRSDAEGWAPGMVRATFRSTAAGRFRAVLRTDDHAPRHVAAELFRAGMLLRMAPAAWGRRLPLPRSAEGTLDSDNPRAPTYKRLSAQAAVLSVPSHDPRYRPVLDSLLAAHADELGQLDVLVVDVRGNEGGSARTTDGLLPYYYTAEQEPRLGPSGPAVVLASAGNLRYFRSWVPPGAETPEWLADLLSRIEAYPGEVVPFMVGEGADTEQAPAEAPAVVYDRPHHLAVLSDRGVVSAGEAFLLKAMRHGRVSVFGDRSAGTIDYQTVGLVGLACPSSGLLLGIPRIAASGRLPVGGINPAGIPPDVPIGPEVEDPIAFILDHFGIDKAP